MNAHSDSKLTEVLRSAAENFFPAAEEAVSMHVGTRSPDGDTPLHLFAWRSDVGSARVLIEAGADVNALGDMSTTPLHIALGKACEPMVILLLQAGARVDIRSEFSETPQELAKRIGGRFAEILANRSSRRSATRGA